MVCRLANLKAIMLSSAQSDPWLAFLCPGYGEAAGTKKLRSDSLLAKK